MISSIRGNRTDMGVQVPSDTLNPHERPFTGMLDHHPGSASGRRGCSISRFLLGGPPLTGPVLALVGDDDRCRVAVTGAKGAVARVISQDGARGA